MNAQVGSAPNSNWREANSTIFQETIGAAAARLNIQPLAVEKDYWVCEALRGIQFAYPQQTVFKGGTSLEKMRIIQRFSEDLDIMVAGDIGGSKVAPRVLKEMCVAAARATGGVLINESSGGNNGTFHREADLEFQASSQSASNSAIANPNSIQLELGQSTGTNPCAMHEVTSLLARELQSSGIRIAEFTDLAPFDVQMLHPGRTLLEKLLRVNTFASIQGKTMQYQMTPRIGRQFYDIWALLGDDQVNEFLDDRAQVAQITADCIDESIRFGGDAPVPEGGFGNSTAFARAGELSEALRSEHEQAMIQLYYGSEAGPTFDAVLSRVEERSEALNIQA